MGALETILLSSSMTRDLNQMCVEELPLHAKKPLKAVNVCVTSEHVTGIYGKSTVCDSSE